MLNITTIHALRKTSALSKPLKTFLLSLAISDLGVGLLDQPLNIAYLVVLLRCNVSNHNILNPWGVVLDIAFLSSFFSIMALSTERFIAIQKPLRYQDIVTENRIVTVVIIIWLLSSFLGISFVLLDLNIALASFVIIKSLCFVATTWSSFKIYLINPETPQHSNTISSATGFTKQRHCKNYESPKICPNYAFDQSCILGLLSATILYSYCTSNTSKQKHGF